MNARPPALFLGHGNPLNALEDNATTRAWRSLGERLPRPRAILAVSAHWYVGATRVTAMPDPPTIHDFRGFPPELFEVAYPAPGDPALARRVAELLAPVPVELDRGWGLDHGTWSVGVHLFPDADVPVVQLAMDASQPAAFHLELGRRLAPLRDEGVLVLGSGNVVHNLARYDWGRGDGAPFDWAARFDARVREALAARDHAALVDLESLGADARLAVPTDEHYLPLLYVLGAAGADAVVRFPVEGFEGRSISMLAVELD